MPTSIMSYMMKAKKSAVISDVKTAPPIQPSHVFFGLICGTILCLPKNEPQKYAKTSPQRAVFCMLNKKREVPVRNLPSVCRFAERLPRTAVYTTPWASIAVATFSKPAMLAPAARLPFMPYFSAAS